MKKLFVAALLVVGMTAFAQDGDGKALQKRNVDNEQMSPEQRNELQLKKLTLDLGLSDSQQKQMATIINEQQAKRQALYEERKANKEKGIKPTADERFKKENQMLDDKIAVKASVKKILNKEQFEKWEQLNEQKKERAGDRRKKNDAPGKE